MADTAWRSEPDGVVLTVRVQPRARRESVGGRVALPDGEALSVSVTAPPEDGRANEAVAAALAAALDVAKRDVALLSGAAARIKRFRIAGDAGRIAARLARLAES